MPKLIVFPSPFRSERQFVTVEDGTTIREACALVGPSLHMPGAVLILNDQVVSLSDHALSQDDTLIVRSVPAGGIGDAIGKAAGEAWKVMGQMVQNPILLFSGLFLIGGAMTFLYSLGASAVTSVLPKPPYMDTSTTAGSLGVHGGRNGLKPFGQVPIVLGKSLISPPLGSKVYTDWDGSNPAKQILYQLFVVGLGRLAISAAKIGDKALTDFGVAPTMTVQTLSNDTYGKIVTEAGVGIELKASAPQVQVSVPDIDSMSLDITFPNGLCSYNSDGARVASRTIALTVEYKKTTTASWTGAASIALSYSENFTQAVAKKVEISAALLTAAGRAGYTGTWDVRVTRTTDDSTDSKYVDRTAWSVLRSVQAKEPISAAAKGITTRIALTIQATDQLNGAVDNFNVEAQSVVPCYDGTGTGPGEWKGSTALGYPSTWKNVNMTTGGFTWNTWTGNPTSNPAALYLWILRGPANPKPIPDTLIDWPAFEAWYTFCETKGLEVNAVWDQGGEVLALLDRIAQVGRGARMMRDSKYSVIFDQPQTVPVQHFTPRNSRNFSASKFFPTPVHAIRAQFIDKASAWKQAEQRVYMAGYSEATATEFRTVQLWGVTNYQQAYKAIFYQVAVETLRPEVYQMEVDFEHLTCQRGDLVVVSHDVLLYGLQAARVVSLTANGGGQALTVTLDEEVTLEMGKSYGLRWRRMSGASIVAPVNTVIGTTRTLTFTTPVAVGSVPEVDDLCSFGEAGLETQPMLVVSIEMQDEFSARVTLNNYDDAVYSADSGSIPAWSSGISLPAPVGYGVLPDLSVPTTVPPNPEPAFLPNPLYPPASKIYAHWSYDEQPAMAVDNGDIRDSSGNGRSEAGGRQVDGTDGGSPWTNRQVRSGMGLRTGGGTSTANRAYANLGVRTDYPDATGQFWVAGWIEIPSDYDASTTVWGVLGHCNETSGGLAVDTSGQGWILRFRGSDLTLRVNYGKPGTAFVSTALATVTVGLHHVLFDYRSDGPELWVDGKLVGKGTTGDFFGDIVGTISGLSALTKNIRAGLWVRGATSNAFRGYVDEVILGTGTLTDAEKIGLYALMPGPQLSVAQAEAELARVQAEAHADSIVTAEEAARIAQAAANLAAANAYSELQAGTFPGDHAIELYLDFNNDVKDRSGKGLDATINGTVAFVDGRTGKALSTPGTSGNFVNRDLPASLNSYASGFVIVARLAIPTNGTEGLTIYASADSTKQLHFRHSGGVLGLAWHDSGGTARAINSAIAGSSTTREFAAVWTVATSTMAFYLDGAFVGQLAATSIFAGLNRLRIGRNNSSTYYAVTAEDLRLDSRPWTQLEVIGWARHRAMWRPAGVVREDVVAMTARHLGAYLDTAPTAGAIDDSYIRFSATAGPTNRGVFKWTGFAWVRTEERRYLERALVDISVITSQRSATTGAAIYGAASDYTGDSTVQAAIALFTDAIINYLQAGIIKSLNWAAGGLGGANGTSRTTIDLNGAKILQEWKDGSGNFYTLEMSAANGYKLTRGAVTLVHWHPTTGVVKMGDTFQYDPATGITQLGQSTFRAGLSIFGWTDSELKGGIRPTSLYHEMLELDVSSDIITPGEAILLNTPQRIAGYNAILDITIEIRTSTDQPVAMHHFRTSIRVQNLVAQIGTPVTPIPDITLTWEAIRLGVFPNYTYYDRLKVTSTAAHAGRKLNFYYHYVSIG